MSSFEENSSPEERIAYLRERGVEVELPEDRKTTKAPTDEKDLTYIRTVKIPCNEKEPVKEIRVPISKKLVGDQLQKEALKKFFGGEVSIDAMKAAAATQFANQGVTLSTATVAKMNEMASVEAFPLSRPCDTNRHVQVNMYVDEAGQLKNLPSNFRASQFASLCGFKGVPFVGDVFIGRVGPTEWGRSNVDFFLSDFDSGAQWLKGVEAQNYQHGVESNRVVMESDQQVALEEGGDKKYKNFTWRQDDENVEIIVPVPAAIAGKIVTKNVKVTIKSSAVKVEILNTSSGDVVVESGKEGVEFLSTPVGQLIPLVDIAELHQRIAVDDSTWFVSGRDIQVSLFKSSGDMWPVLEKDGK